MCCQNFFVVVAVFQVASKDLCDPGKKQNKKNQKKRGSDILIWEGKGIRFRSAAGALCSSKLIKIQLWLTTEDLIVGTCTPLNWKKVHSSLVTPFFFFQFTFALEPLVSIENLIAPLRNKQPQRNCRLWRLGTKQKATALLQKKSIKCQSEVYPFWGVSYQNQNPVQKSIGQKNMPIQQQSTISHFKLSYICIFFF